MTLPEKSWHRYLPLWPSLKKRFQASTRGPLWFLRLLVESWQAFQKDDGGTRAAAIGFYALLSLFPLLVLLALTLTALLGENEARSQALLFASRYLPTRLQLVDDIVQNVIDNRGALSTIAVGALLWGGIQIFRVLERAINRAWGAPKRRGFWRHLRFVLLMLSSMGLLTFISITATALFELARPLNLPFTRWAPLQHHLLWALISSLPPLALSVTLLALLYRYVPHGVHVRWADVLPGALLAALLWESAKRGFAFYLSHFARQNYNLLYGSLGVILALLTWLYLTGYIILLGAEFSAILFRHRQEGKFPRRTVWKR